MRAARRPAGALRHDRRRRPARRAAARAAARRRDRRRPAGRDRLGRGARRLLLGLHADRGHRRGRPSRRASVYDLVLEAQLAGLERSVRGRRRPRGRRGRPRGHRRRRPRRALRPRPRPRRRPRGPRGAARCRGARTGRARRRATSSPSSPASTCRASSGCGSRIWSSSPTRHARGPHPDAQRAHHRRLTLTADGPSNRAAPRRGVGAVPERSARARPLGETLPARRPHVHLALAEQVREHQPELDELIRRHATDWPLERIAPLERSILRVALLEMLYPERGARRARRSRPRGRSTRRSRPPSASAAPARPAFINGILGAVLRERRPTRGSRASP